MTNKQVRKVAFITGASRGIGAESAVALAKAGWNVAITARTLNEGEAQNYAVGQRALPGSLTATAQAVNEVGGEALCLGDILDQASVVAPLSRRSPIMVRLICCLITRYIKVRATNKIYLK